MKRTGQHMAGSIDDAWLSRAEDWTRRAPRNTVLTSFSGGRRGRVLHGTISQPTRLVQRHECGHGVPPSPWAER
jgi:hypothetical protein